MFSVTVGGKEDLKASLVGENCTNKNTQQIKACNQIVLAMLLQFD